MKRDREKNGARSEEVKGETAGSLGDLVKGRAVIFKRFHFRATSYTQISFAPLPFPCSLIIYLNLPVSCPQMTRIALSL
jgi:hypothetical protein